MPFLPFSNILSLREELDGTDADILTWGCDGYVESIKQWSETCDTYVGAIVRVTSTDQAAIVVRFATHHDIPFTARGGGLSTSGASTTHGGIVLDLSSLRAVHVDAAARVVTAQGGALWADIDVAAAQHGLAVVGSTLSHIGAAGATLGGGYGWLTGEYGLAIDNLLWARMVLADGSVVTASEKEHSDLFWAIRGAGQSFGVAVELGFRAHRQDQPVFAGTLVFSREKLPAIVEFANRFEAITDGRQGFWFGFTMLPSMAQSQSQSKLQSQSQCSILAVVFYNGPQPAAERFFAPLLSLPSVLNSTGMLPYDSLNDILSTVDTLGPRRSSLSKHTANIPYPVDPHIGPRKSLQGSNITLPLAADFVALIYDDFNSILRAYPQTQEESRLLFELLPHAQVSAVSNSATAFANRGPHYNVSALFEWADARLDARIRALQSDLVARIGSVAGIAAKPGYSVAEHGTGIYANYAGHGTPVRAIFGENLARLRALKEKYDPHNTFRKWHNLCASVDAPA
ncbi:FAD-binding oxidoreductase [Aspergillus lucknowensis]|uniref:FAD-binding PCMH-type domain-containing protein n=1 Tax=Aspergillus lucknowensis TaxID=176173 RepID=A0ABR4LCI5_9EURO